MNPILHCVLSWLSFIFLMPLIAAIFLPLKIYKTIVIRIAWIFKKELTGILTSYDSIFAIDKFYVRPYAGNGTVIIVDGHLSIHDIRRCFIQRILSVRKDNGELQFGKLLQVPVTFGGYFFWSNLESVDVAKQIRVSHSFVTDDHETELHGVLGKMMTEPFPGALWEVLSFEKYNRNQTVIVFRLHHVLGDGYTFNHLVDRLIGKQSDYLVRHHERTWMETLKLISTAPSRMVTLYTEAFTHKDIYTQAKVNTTGVLSMTTFDLDLVKKVRRVSETHFAIVGMFLLAGALRRYFLENHKEHELPPWVSIMHSLPKGGHPLKEMVNHWGVGLFKIPMEQPSALARLQQAEANYGKYMDDQYNDLIHTHMPLFNLLPATLIRLFFSNNFGTGMGFTSVPGYGKQADLMGHRVGMMYKVFGLQWKESAIAAAVYTQNANLGFSIFANKDILPDQEAVDRVTRMYLHDEFRELLNECGIKENNNQTLRLPHIKRSIRAEGFA